MLRKSIVAGVLVAALASSASAQSPKPIRLLLTPAKPPTPALRYQLLPDARVTTSGNAADIYRQVIDLLTKKPRLQESSLMGSLLEMPLKRFPKDEVHKEIAAYSDVCELLDKAACRDYCDWGYRERLRKDGINALIPEMQSMRECATLLAVKARLEMAEGHPDQALATLRTGMALAKHAGETETLIAFLVGAAIATRMEMQLDQFVSLPDAPNLYYALTDLPAPLIDMRKSFESERLAIVGTFPGVGEAALNLDASNVSEDDLKKCLKVLDELSDQRFGYADHLTLAWNIEQKHEIAKKALIAAGRPKEKVEAMPHLQVAFLHALLEYDAALDNIMVELRKPYWEMADLDQNNRALRNRWMDYNSSAIPLAPMILPAVRGVTFARVRIERKVALLRTVEAIRCYAAAHDGQLPPSLAAIKEVPLPRDPATGKDFEYQLNGPIARLRAPVPGKQNANLTNSVVYELAIRK